MPTIKGHVRRSQLITTYGVGSIIPVADEAFMVAALEHWRVDRPDLHEPRLQRELRVDGFVQPPATRRPAGRPGRPVSHLAIMPSVPTAAPAPPVHPLGSQQLP